MTGKEMIEMMTGRDEIVKGSDEIVTGSVTQQRLPNLGTVANPTVARSAAIQQGVTSYDTIRPGNLDLCSN
jgi:hypothetical protein